MLDVLLTISETTNKSYVSLARHTIKQAVEIAQFPINVIETEGVPGHIGKAMVNGIAKCKSKYVVWVDDDDWILPNAFSCLEKHLKEDVSAIAAREIQLYNNGRLLPQTHRHHLAAWNRDFLNTVPLKDMPSYGMMGLFKFAGDSVIDELSWVYIYRVYKSEGFKLRYNSTLDELNL